MNIPELSFLVLTSLADQPRHGYAILQEIETMSGGGRAPAVATLYRTIDRLTNDGLVEEAGSDVVDGRFRRIHRLTDGGRTVLAAEAEQRARTARLAIGRLGRRPAGDREPGAPTTGTSPAGSQSAPSRSPIPGLLGGAT